MSHPVPQVTLALQCHALPPGHTLFNVMPFSAMPYPQGHNSSNVTPYLLEVESVSLQIIVFIKSQRQKSLSD